MSEATTPPTVPRGRGMVVLLWSKSQSLNPGAVLSFFSVKVLLEKIENNKKEAGVGPY